MKSKALLNFRWRRVILKISGATLTGSDTYNIDPKVAMLISREVAIASHLGVEVAIIGGGRNFFCGDAWVAATGLERCTAYQVGELVSRGVTPMDMTALTFCEKNAIPVNCYSLHITLIYGMEGVIVTEPGNISKALCGEQVGTLVDQTGAIS
ncbi:uridylate kinase PUMPKIN, chloroplastic-like [Arachis hypogaea]|uniref:uridylate kinase PUMPKIN, chloroplastic-like n=1 Tax=Arachis hypogaea TaxID=3818 RepID=UPI000DEC6073|nr:uncharacterized protein LOC112748733 [Arachis hypogaea]